MNLFLICLLLGSFQLLAKPACSFPSLRNDELKHAIQDEYLEWKKKFHVTRNVARQLTYTLSIEGPEILGSYTIPAAQMETIRNLILIPAHHGNEWYSVQLKADYNSDRGIAEQTIAFNALSLDELEHLAENYLPQLKKDISSARKEIEKECVIQ
jgi:hypothetical protein